MSLPNWVKIDEALQTQNVSDATDHFRALHAWARKDSDEEIVRQAEFASTTWDFIIQFAAKRNAFRKLAIETVNRLAEIPIWVNAYNARSDLHGHVTELHVDLQDAFKRILENGSNEGKLVTIDTIPVEGWPEWEPLPQIITAESYGDAGDQFNAIKSKVMQSTLDEIGSQIAHAEVAWKFLFAFAVKKTVYRNHVKSLIQHLKDAPGWIDVVKNSEDLHSLASRLHQDLREVLGPAVTVIPVKPDPSLEPVIPAKPEPSPAIPAKPDPSPEPVIPVKPDLSLHTTPPEPPAPEPSPVIPAKPDPSPEQVIPVKPEPSPVIPVTADPSTTPVYSGGSLVKASDLLVPPPVVEDPGNLSGEWEEATISIRERKLTWAGHGATNKIIYDPTNPFEFHMTCKGDVTVKATLRSEANGFAGDANVGKLCWSDGDVWSRVDVFEVVVARIENIVDSAYRPLDFSRRSVIGLVSGVVFKPYVKISSSVTTRTTWAYHTPSKGDTRCADIGETFSLRVPQEPGKRNLKIEVFDERQYTHFGQGDPMIGEAQLDLDGELGDDHDDRDDHKVRIPLQRGGKEKGTLMLSIRNLR